MSYILSVFHLSKAPPANITPDDLLVLFPPVKQGGGTQSPAPVQMVPLALLYSWIVH